MHSSDFTALPQAPAEDAQASRRTLGALLLVVLCGLVAQGVSWCHAAEVSPPASDIKAGEALFVTNCAACHPDGGNIISATKPVRNSVKLKDFETFLAWVRAPREPMPPFPPTQIPDGQARELYRYVAEVMSQPTAK